MSMKTATDLEQRRLALQGDLDAGKDQAERNRMGQFATPTGLAEDILRYARRQLANSGNVRFLDPAIGTGSFYSALIGAFPKACIDTAAGYEIDPHYGLPAARLWGNTRLDLHLEDFTRARAPVDSAKFNLLICNPPYVRHHHLPNAEKQRLKADARASCGVDFNGLAGLYCYFLGLSHSWMADGCLAGWLIPSEFMDVNYGISLKRYLLDMVTLLHIHRFDPNDVQFGDALVSSAVVWFRKEAPPEGHEVRFTYGGSLVKPKLERSVAIETLRRSPKWTRYPMKEAFEGNGYTPIGRLLHDQARIGNREQPVLHTVRRRNCAARTTVRRVPSDIAESALSSERRGCSGQEGKPCPGPEVVPAGLPVDGG